MSLKERTSAKDILARNPDLGGILVPDLLVETPPAPPALKQLTTEEKDRKLKMQATKRNGLISELA